LKRRCHQRPAAAGEHHAKLSRCWTLLCRVRLS
jgi:hypothetical protein